jgi:hypothetical protein
MKATWTWFRGMATCVCFAVVCAPAVSAAGEPAPADVQAARKLGTEGVKLANAGKCSDAVEKLSRAEKLFHAPTILGRLGECQIALGKIVEGTENLQRVVRESLPANAPPAYVAAKARAQKTLDAAMPKIAHLTVNVKAPRGATVTVKIDGETLSDAMVGASRPTDPGDHKVEAEAPDFLTSSKSVSLAEGQTSSVTLSLEPDPAAKSHAAPAAAPPPAKPAEQASTRRTLGYVAVGVGGVGLIAGSIFGVIALSKRNDLDQHCFNKVCPLDKQGEIDSARTNGTISTIGFAVAGIGIAAGATLLLWPDAVKVKTGEVAIQPSLGVGMAGVNGTF